MDVLKNVVLNFGSQISVSGLPSEKVMPVRQSQALKDVDAA